MKNLSGTPGGYRLRILRERAGKSQFAVEVDAGLGSGYLQRVEAGKVIQPERETLERILTALGAGYSERRQILEMFGYVVRTPLPRAPEINWALSVCHHELHGVTFPVYVLDCSHRLLGYNAYFPKLLGVKPGSPFVTGMVGLSMLHAWFDPAYGLVERLENPEEFLRLQIQALKFEMRLFTQEEWYPQVIGDLLQIPLFRQYWEADDANSYAVAARPTVLVGINVPNVGLLHFRLTSETFIQDMRFRIIYYLPADVLTIQQCSQWAQEINRKES